MSGETFSNFPKGIEVSECIQGPKITPAGFEEY
jgi:hypothetical protein